LFWAEPGIGGQRPRRISRAKMLELWSDATRAKLAGELVQGGVHIVPDEAIGRMERANLALGHRETGKLAFRPAGCKRIGHFPIEWCHEAGARHRRRAE